MKVAVFFDCENVSAKYVEYVFKELSNKNKKVIIARAFKNWARPSDWSEDLVQKQGIKPMQVFSKSGKNSADLAIAISVMKELARGIVDGIVLVSSDSDFSVLAQEIKANGREAIIFAEDKANESLKNCCDLFIPLPQIISSNKQNRSNPLKQHSINDQEIEKILKEVLKELDAKCDSEGFCKVAQIGVYLKQTRNLSLKDFKAQSYKKLFDRFKDSFEYNLVGSTLAVRLVKFKGFDVF
ncbi:NYN domain-containing protein [Campylobacter troglodytis]|uniref:NYN domain-containing protein n=1 Tax=Campylobacter troglodytis TaxID=654363 RepID=UPI00115AFF55|nr:NYN domain-containing protein [Campylobacter troglodytis]TQR61540.1 hypothetical protein DMC01_00790 [Campylobacter troglodytis]